MKILLASSSPRRKEILSKIVSDFDVESVDSDENYCGDSIQETVLEIARRKQRAVKNTLRYDIIITCDTIVFLNDKCYGKPLNRDDAFMMLQELSGRRHMVISAVVVMCHGVEKYSIDTSFVTLKKLSVEDINNYLDKYEYLDKAGGYAIQHNVVVSSFEGNYSNIVGLPKESLEIILKDFGLVTV